MIFKNGLQKLITLLWCCRSI